MKKDEKIVWIKIDLLGSAHLILQNQIFRDQKFEKVTETFCKIFFFEVMACYKNDWSIFTLSNAVDHLHLQPLNQRVDLGFTRDHHCYSFVRG